MSISGVREAIAPRAETLRPGGRPTWLEFVRATAAFTLGDRPESCRGMPARGFVPLDVPNLFIW